jgi:hypothetical protein
MSQQPPAISEKFWSWARGEDYYPRLRDYVSMSCGADACRISGWDGSPDHAGVGVTVQLHVQALIGNRHKICPPPLLVAITKEGLQGYISMRECQFLCFKSVQFTLIGCKLDCSDLRDILVDLANNNPSKQLPKGIIYVKRQ